MSTGICIFTDCNRILSDGVCSVVSTFFELVFCGAEFSLPLETETKIPTSKTTFTIISAKHALAFVVYRKPRDEDEAARLEPIVVVVSDPAVQKPCFII